MVKAFGPGALMYKRDLWRGYHQIWTDPFDVPFQGFFWQGAFYFDTVLVMGCTSSAYICQCVTSAIAHIHNSWGALCANYLDDQFHWGGPSRQSRKGFLHIRLAIARHWCVGFRAQGLPTLLTDGCVRHHV